jgi:orotidine-5'-phosphate decarboxylase
MLSEMHFSDKLAAVIKAKDSCLMLGLDPNWEKVPAHLKIEKPSLQQKADIYEKFCTDMVGVCADKVCGIKIQMGYFEALGSVGVKAVENIIAYTRSEHPELIIMMDAKRGDIGSTSEAYAQAFLSNESPLAGDCVTVAPYMGSDSIVPFDMLAEEFGKGVFVLAKTSNPSSVQVQDIVVSNGDTIAERWSMGLADLSQKYKSPNQKYSHYGAVVGATHPEELPKFREILKSCWMLCPGVGAQGGKIEDVLAIRDEDGLGVLIPVSRAVLYASEDEDYLEAAQAEVEKLWEAQKM